jgi:hypothetical protein
MKINIDKIRKDKLEELRDAYSICLDAFHKVKHLAVEKNIHDALFYLNRAIKDLEECLNATDRID